VKSRGHLILSIGKSVIRIATSVIAIMAGMLEIAIIGYAVAELLGVAEELVDKRG
jgi:hypothetical protein